METARGTTMAFEGRLQQWNEARGFGFIEVEATRERTRCEQMTSCAEATWFLQHCPGVKMDGNHDGVPCERQWCTGR